jgi:hypothetical protein
MKNELKNITELLERNLDENRQLLISARESTNPSLSKVIVEFQGDFKLFKQDVMHELGGIKSLVLNNKERIDALCDWRESKEKEISAAKGTYRGAKFVWGTLATIAALFVSGYYLVTDVIETHITHATPK